MKMSFRWYGEGFDSVKLWQIRQIPGMVGIIGTLYDSKPGEEWDLEAIRSLKKQVNDAGLDLLGIESVNIHDAIKAGTPDRDGYIQNYIRTIRKLGSEGIRMICYNFMPVFDWTRSDLAKVRPDGSTVLAYDQHKIDQIDPQEMFTRLDGDSNGFVLPGWEPERMILPPGLLTMRPRSSTSPACSSTIRAIISWPGRTTTATIWPPTSAT